MFLENKCYFWFHNDYQFELKIIYDKEVINKNNCNICLDIFQEKEELIKLKCDHLYHTNCIAEWLKKHSNKCPICRDEIAKGTPINL